MESSKKYSSSEFKSLFIKNYHTTSEASYNWFVNICRAYELVLIQKKGRENFYILNEKEAQKYGQ